jgi:hypothetical protein
MYKLFDVSAIYLPLRETASSVTVIYSVLYSLFSEVSVLCDPKQVTNWLECVT